MRNQLRHRLPAILLAFLLLTGLLPSAVMAGDTNFASDASNPLATLETGHWTNRPGLSVRLLEGDGSDPTKEFSFTDADYTKKLTAFTLQIELTYYLGHESPVLTIDSKPSADRFYYIAAKGFTDPAAIGAGTVVTEKKDTQIRKLVYHLNPVTSSSMTKVELNVTFTPTNTSYPAVYPAAQWPVNIDFTATDSGSDASVYVDRDASTLTFADVPDENFLKDTAFVTNPVSVTTTKASLRAGTSEEMSFQLFSKNFSSFLETYMPYCTGVDLTIMPQSPGIEIVGANTDQYSPPRELNVTKQPDGSYVIENVPVTCIPTSSSKVQYKLKLRLSAADADYDQSYSMRITDLKFLGYLNGRKYTQTIGSGRELTVSTLKAPVPGTLTVSTGSGNGTLWYNVNGDMDEGGQKYNNGQAPYWYIRTVFGPEANGCEQIPVKGLSAELTLPKGLAPGNKLTISGLTYSVEFLRKGESVWESGAPYLTTTTRDTVFAIPAAADGKGPVERLRVTDTSSECSSFSIYITQSWAATPDRDGSPLSPNQEDPVTATITGHQEDGSPVSQSSTYTVIYQPYDAPRLVNGIGFTGTTQKTYGTSVMAIWDICTPNGQRREEADRETDDLPCYTGRDWYVKSNILLYNDKPADNTRPMPQANMVYELKPADGAKLVFVDSMRIIGKQVPSDAKEVFGDPDAQVAMTLSDGRNLTMTQADLPYTAPEGVSIQKVRFTFPKQLTSNIYNVAKYKNMLYTQQDHSPMFQCGFNLDPDSELAREGHASYEYLTLSLVSSDKLPANSDGSAHSAYRVARDVPVVVPRFDSPGPYSYQISTTKPAVSGATAGTNIKITTGTAYKRNPGMPTVHINQEAEDRAAEGRHYVTYRVDQHFTYINKSHVLADGSPEVTVTWKRGFFADGDGLLRFDAEDGVPNVTSFQLNVNRETTQGTYVPVPTAYLGGDFSGLVEVTANAAGYPSDQDSRVTIHYTEPARQSEQELGLDLNMDGTLGSGPDAVVLTSVSPTSGVTVSALSLEGVLVFGSSQEDFVEGSGPYYGNLDDAFTYRTHVLSMRSQTIKNLVLYIPVPREGVAPSGNSAANEWNAAVGALNGDILEKLGTGDGKYQLWYSTRPDAAMQELYNLEDVAGSYIAYDPLNPPDLSKVTMFKAKASLLPESTSDDLGMTFQNHGMPQPHSLTNHMETYYRYDIDRNDGKGYVTTFGPTPSVRYIIPYMAVEGKAYLDRDYDGHMDLNENDQPLAGVSVALFDASGTQVAATSTAADGSFALSPQTEGQYYLQIDPATLGISDTTRRLAVTGNGSDIDPATGRSSLFTVDRRGVTGMKIGTFDEKSFWLCSDAAHTDRLAEDEVIDLELNGKTTVYADIIPGYAFQMAKAQPQVTLDASGKVTASIANSVITLDGVDVTAADSPIRVTATMADGAGGTVTHSFKVRVLPPRVVAKFEDNLNFYTDVLYQKDELAGGITLQNRFYNGSDLLPGGLEATGVFRYKEDGTIDESDPLAWGEMTETKTFTESQIGKFALLYEGTDAYGRRVVDVDGSSRILRTVYVHGYPYLNQKAPIQTRVNSGYNPMREQDGATYLTATHQHVYTNDDGTVEVRADETFTSDLAKADITLLGYYPYASDGSDFEPAAGKFRAIDITSAAERDKLITSTPTEPGAYEVFYSIRMGTRQAVLTLHRTTYLHGSPAMYVPTLISMKPEEGKPVGSDMDLDYASEQVWRNKLLDMNDLKHVREDGTIATYSRATTKFYRQNGDELTGVIGTGGDIGGWSVIAAPKETADGGGGYGGKPANAFLREDSRNVLKNRPDTYEVTVVFQDTLDDMGSPGTPGNWNENWAALYQKGGIGCTEMKVKVLVTSDNVKPIFPSQDQLITNFVQGDSVWFSRLTDFDDKSATDIAAAYGANVAAELESRIAARRVIRVEYESWIRYYQAEESEVATPITGQPDHFANKTGEDFLYLMTQMIRYKTHDVDIHALAPEMGSALTDSQYRQLHNAAVTLLWRSVRLTKLNVPVLGQTEDQTYLNPTNEQLLEIVRGNPGTLEATFSAADVAVEAAGDPGDPLTGNAVTDDTVTGFGYRLTLKTDDTVEETYKVYLHSNLLFERANGAPLVTYGLHIPSALPHASMPLNAYFTGAKALQKVSYPAAVLNPNISSAGTYVNMDYSYTHPIEGVLPTLRDRTVHYYGRAFVNGDVRLLYRNEASLPASFYSLTGGDVQIADGFTALVDKWTELPADDSLDGTSGTYPPVNQAYETAGQPGEISADGGAKYLTNQPASLKIYEGGAEIFDSRAASPAGSISSQAPGRRVLTYVAEDTGPDDNHPYHNGPNRKTATVSYVFDTPVSITFGSNVSQTRDEERNTAQYTLKALKTATDDELKAMLEAGANVVYGDSSNLLPSDVAVSYEVLTAGDQSKSIKVTAEARNSNRSEETVRVIPVEPPVIVIRQVDESGRNLAEPITIDNVVLGKPYTVPAPYLEGYVPTGDLLKTIASVQEGENELAFSYRAETAGEQLADYTIVYRLDDGTVLMSLEASGAAGREARHTAPAYYYKDSARYALADGEAAEKTIILSADGSNRMEFLYEPAPEVVPVQYTVQYVYEDSDGSTAVAETHSLVGTVGGTVSAEAPASFSRDGYKYTLKSTEPKTKTLTLGTAPETNVISFLYDRTVIPPSGGGGGGGGTSVVNYYAVLFIPGPYGTLEGKGEWQVRWGQRVTDVPKVIPAEGYEFLGWYTESKDKLVDPSKQMVQGNLTFYAAYTGPDGDTIGGTDAPKQPANPPLLNLDDHLEYLYGDAAGTFRPDSPITRAEVTAMFSRLLKDPMPENLNLPSKFPDVPADRWYSAMISYMEKYGVILGYPDGTFAPEQSITRAEFLAVVTRFTKEVLTDEQLFPDVPLDHWAAVYVNSAMLHGWITGYPDGTFRPNEKITRAEAAKIVNGLLNRQPDAEFIDGSDALKDFPDLAKEHWGYYEIMEATNFHDYDRKNETERWTKLK